MFELNDEEWHILQGIPREDVVELAICLDMAPSKEVDARQLLGMCIPRLLRLLQERGVPLTRYDAADLEELAPDERATLGRIMGLTGSTSTRALLRSGARASKTYQREPALQPVVYMLASLWRPLLRHASSQEV